jgi:hypothetical protein
MGQKESRREEVELFIFFIIVLLMALGIFLFVTRYFLSSSKSLSCLYPKKQETHKNADRTEHVVIPCKVEDVAIFPAIPSGLKKKFKAKYDHQKAKNDIQHFYPPISLT